MRKKPSRVQDIAFKPLPVKGIKIGAYSGVLPATPLYRHYLDCEAIGEAGIAKTLKLYDANRSTHRYRFWYRDRENITIGAEIFNFEIDLGSHLLDPLFKNYDLVAIREVVKRIDQCAKHVIDSVAATAVDAEDYKLVHYPADIIFRRNIKKSIFYQETGEIDLERYWLLILDTAARNCYRDKGTVEGIILD